MHCAKEDWQDKEMHCTLLKHTLCDVIARSDSDKVEWRIRLANKWWQNYQVISSDNPHRNRLRLLHFLWTDDHFAGAIQNLHAVFLFAFTMICRQYWFIVYVVWFRWFLAMVWFCCYRCYDCWLVDNELHDALTHASNKSWFFHQSDPVRRPKRMRWKCRGSERIAPRKIACINSEKKKIINNKSFVHMCMCEREREIASHQRKKNSEK